MPTRRRATSTSGRYYSPFYPTTAYFSRFLGSLQETALVGPLEIDAVRFHKHHCILIELFAVFVGNDPGQSLYDAGISNTNHGHALTSASKGPV